MPMVPRTRGAAGSPRGTRVSGVERPLSPLGADVLVVRRASGPRESDVMVVRGFEYQFIVGCYGDARGSWLYAGGTGAFVSKAAHDTFSDLTTTPGHKHHHAA